MDQVSARFSSVYVGSGCSGDVVPRGGIPRSLRLGASEELHTISCFLFPREQRCSPGVLAREGVGLAGRVIEGRPQSSILHLGEA